MEDEIVVVVDGFNGFLYVVIFDGYVGVFLVKFLRWVLLIDSLVICFGYWLFYII